ncbi:MAG: hypothetical protein V1845_03530 [bacterium]
MDFKNFYKIIKDNIKFIAIFTAIVLIIVELFSWYISGGYDVSLSLSVFTKGGQAAKDYEFDGYFSVKAANEFADTVAQWTKSPAVINDIYRKAGVSPPAEALKSFYQKIGAQKMSPQYVEIKFNSDTAQDGTKIAKAIGGVFTEKAEQASKLSGDVVFSVVSSEPVITKNQGSFISGGIIALVAGFLLAIFIILLKENDDRN